MSLEIYSFNNIFAKKYCHQMLKEIFFLSNVKKAQDVEKLKKLTLLKRFTHFLT